MVLIFFRKKNIMVGFIKRGIMNLWWFILGKLRVIIFGVYYFLIFVYLIVVRGKMQSIGFF